MTFRQTASAMRRLADAIDSAVAVVGSADLEPGMDTKPTFNADAAVGAAAMLCYLRDLVSGGGRETYDQASLLVILHTISEDAEIFPLGVGELMWNAEE